MKQLTSGILLTTLGLTVLHGCVGVDVKTAQPSSWVHFKSMSQPPVDSWEDFYSIDWNQFQTVKFHTPPLKHMTTQEALDLVEYLR